MANDPGPFVWLQNRMDYDFHMCLGSMEAAVDPERYEWDFDDFGEGA